VPKNSVILRCNFAFQQDSIIKSAKIVPSEADLMKITKQLSEIKEADDTKVKFIHTIGHRGVLILSGKGLSPDISGTHPGYQVVRDFVTTAVPKRENVPVIKCKALNKEAEKTASVVNDWLRHAQSVLERGHFPTNFILVRGAGNALPNLPKLKGWAMLADLPVEKAIGKLCGMAILNKPADLQKLTTSVKKALKKYKAVYVQIKGTDEFSHDGNFIGKTKFIEELDSKFIQKIVHELSNNIAICITADHTTSSVIKTHTNNPVPVLLYVPGEIGDCLRFSEKLAARGSLAWLTGNSLFKVLQKLLLFD